MGILGDANPAQYMVDAGLGGISSVVSTVPTGSGYNLGQIRYQNGNEYRLVNNAGNSAITPGLIATPSVGSVGAYSVTVSTASKSFHNFGAVVCVHATVPTGSYFWGAVRGNVGGLVVDATSVPTGSAFFIASNGQVELLPASVITGNYAIGVNLGSLAAQTMTTGTRSGNCVITLT